MQNNLASTDADNLDKISDQTTTEEHSTNPILDVWEKWWSGLKRRGWADLTLRIGTAMVSIALVGLVLWVMSSFYLKGRMVSASDAEMAALPAEQSDTTQILPAYAGVASYNGISRAKDFHTYLPNQSRFDIQEYIVQPGDSVFGIADKYGLNPQTILWGNYDVLYDNPERIQPDMVLKILPVDGVLYTWTATDGLNGVAEFFGVSSEDIIGWPGNNLTHETVGDYAKPNIAEGTQIVVPGGTREFIDWLAPIIRRDSPATAGVWGVGRCEPITTGPVGDEVYVWPTTEHRISGYHYSVESNHRGIDIGGALGNPIFAVDKGVVVYAGWNDNGYGNLVIIDHGTGWQSLYAHLDSLAVACGDYITTAGQVIGTMGSTGRSSGPHLHFELMNEGFGRVNPHNFIGY